MAFKDFLTAGLDRAGLKSQAEYVDFGFGQVEPNHLSAQRTGQIYAQLLQLQLLPCLSKVSL